MKGPCAAGGAAGRGCGRAGCGRAGCKQAHACSNRHADDEGRVLGAKGEGVDQRVERARGGLQVGKRAWCSGRVVEGASGIGGGEIERGRQERLIALGAADSGDQRGHAAGTLGVTDGAFDGVTNKGWGVPAKRARDSE